MKRHPNNMNKTQLKELVFAMSWAALDLAQHLWFTADFLDNKSKKKAYEKATQMAYDITKMPYEKIEKSNIDVSFYGDTGLEKLSSFTERKK